jgi:cytochrome c oxidase assembly protein subunit 15
MGTVVGMLSIALTIIAWKSEERKWVRWLATSVLFAVIFQGILGGLRVVLVKLDLAIVHACVAQAFFCLTAFLAVVTSRWWLEAADEQCNTGLISFSAACGLAIFLQLILGATMRHQGAGLAIPDFPLNYGHLLPPTDHATLDLANQQRITLNLPPVTLAQIWLHFAHRIGAAIVTILLSSLIVIVLRHHKNAALRRPAFFLIALLILQITLGILTVLLRKPADIASLHVATGALTLMTTFVLMVRAMHLYRPQPRLVPREDAIELPHGVATA